MSAGIENLVANEVLVAPGGKPVLASWDRPFFYISDLNAYPSTYGPVNSTTSSPAGRWTTPLRRRASSSASPIGGARRNRATRPTAARPGRPSPKSISGGGIVLHRRHDRRQHAAKHHLGARGRHAALLHAERRPDLESGYAPRRHQLEQFRQRLLLQRPDGHRRPRAREHVLSL